MGWGAKRIAAELGVARNTVKRYIRDGAAPGIQVYLKQRKLDDDAKAKAVALFDSTAEGTAAVVHDLLAAEGIEADVRRTQPAV
ncbi:Mobile element protein [Vulgatibacter incomptus]|uniref:Mobile element protein n=1 Tax=Vulgatibacter incomptus TaxID=1391653 RepID=A0A0K1PGI0_9BACT|nr:Mobile element protein [Vulgatibacter incomptus]